MSPAPGVPPLVIRSADEQRAHRVTVTGDVDVATRGQLAEALRAATRTHERVIVDLGGVRFLDAAGVGTLVAAQTDARARGRTLVVERAVGPARRLLVLVGVLDRLCGLDSAG